MRIAVRITRASGAAAQAVRAAAGVTGLPLDLLVVEQDVEVACAYVIAPYQKQLELVELVGLGGLHRSCADLGELEDVERCLGAVGGNDALRRRHH